MHSYNYKKWGHMAKDYLYNKGKWVYKDKDGDEEKITQDYSYGFETMVFMAVVSDDYSYSKTWLLDTFCSNHMIGHKEWLLKFDESRRSNIGLADSRSPIEKRVGNMVIKKSNGKPTIIEDMLYVSGMKYNLLSVGQLIEK